MTVNESFNEFVAAFERGENPDTSVYLGRLAGRDRFVLEGMIERYLLTAAPREAYDADAFAAARQTPAFRGVAELAAERGESAWPALLPELRARAGLRRRELSARLAEQLGLKGHEPLVDAAYHDMESGGLRADTVSRPVLDALAVLLDSTTERLRRAGELATGATPTAGRAYARGLEPDSQRLVTPGEEAASADDPETVAAQARVAELFYGSGE